MCGIAGVLRFDAQTPGAARLHAMAALLRHRGPDGTGIHNPPDRPIGFAHARLKVLDLTTGDQPMHSPDGRRTIVFNGEIYNFAALRERLTRAGHGFRTRSDTEVILNAYAEWGVDCVRQLDGMFAFALWDDAERKLMLARDRVGKKPLFVYRDDRQLAFASELKALLSIPGLDRTLDPSALPLYLTYGYVPTPHTFYRRITKLPPATILSVSSTGESQESRFWSVHFDESGTHTEGEAVATLRQLLTGAVERRMVADVPVGAFLSGGLDSTIVAGIMSGLADRPIQTFSIGFEGVPAYDETEYARLAARRFATDHTEFKVQPDAFDVLDGLLDAYDEPFGDSSAIPTSIVARLTRQKVTVALTGDGGDELFAGYLRFHAASVAERVPAIIRQAGARAGMLLSPQGDFRGLSARAARFLTAAAKPLSERYLQWIGFFPNELAALIRPELDIPLDRTRSSFDDILAAEHGRSTTARLLTLNFNTYLLDDLLVKADRCSMMHSLEVRSPFLDTALIEFAATLPGRLLFRRGKTKYILRQAFSDLVPAEILARGKMGFGVPLDLWFRTRWRPVLEERLARSTSPIGQWLNEGAVQELVRAHLRGEKNLGHQLWALLTLDGWLRRAEGGETG